MKSAMKQSNHPRGGKGGKGEGNSNERREKEKDEDGGGKQGGEDGGRKEEGGKAVRMLTTTAPSYTPRGREELDDVHSTKGSTTSKSEFFDEVAHPDERPEGIPGLEKLPTNQFIEGFLDRDDDDDDDDLGEGKSEQPPKKRPITVEPLPDDQDDLESNLDVKEHHRSYDDTGQTAYVNACRRYKTLPSATFHRKLAYASTIDMKHYNIGPRGAASLAIPMVINTKITTLNLKGNDLSGRGIECIGKMMLENTSITDLILSENRLRTHGARVIAEILQENQSIRLLDISDNQFCDSDAKILAKPVEEHPNLRILNLSNNDFGDLASNYLKSMISENGVLQELDLSWNHLRSRGALAIANGVRDNIGMKMLNVSWNGFGEEGAMAMGTALKSCTLTDLDMSNNRVGAEGLVAMVQALKCNDDLKKLVLRKNPIPEEACVAGLEFLKTKMDASELRLELLDLGDIILSGAFKKAVEEVREVHENLEVPFGYTDSYGKRRLKQYNIVEEAMNAMAKYADDRGINIIDLFARFDADGSMSVSHEEFKIGLKEAKVPVTDEQITSLINALDEDGDGEIDFSEMVLGVEMYKTKSSGDT